MESKNLTITAFVNSFLTGLKEREIEVIRARYGLNGGEPLTLQAIGDKYSITRERVRQIEAAALQTLRKKADDTFIKSFVQTATSHLKQMGGVQEEKQFFEGVYGATKSAVDFVAFSNAARFLLELTGKATFAGDNFGNWHGVWYLSGVDYKRAQTFVAKIITALNAKRGENSQAQFDAVFANVSQAAKLSPKVARNYLNISTRFVIGPFQEFGLAHWAEINPKTARDWAYVILKREKRPMHFNEISTLIGKHRTGKNTNLQTIHNELIKDDRFVLVGRGMYGLSEFGLVPGTAREVIAHVLKTHGPLHRDEVVKRVKEQRMLKDGTILINLQNRKHFESRSDGRYYLREV